MSKLISDYAEVVANVRQFNHDLDNRAEIASKLSTFRHWYYVSELGLFGPSKFIGYAQMNAADYQRGSRSGMDGRETEPHLKRWFVQLPPSASQWQQLRSELRARLKEFGKAPNQLATIHVPKASSCGGPDVQLTKLLDRFEALLATLESYARRIDAVLERLEHPATRPTGPKRNHG